MFFATLVLFVERVENAANSGRSVSAANQRLIVSQAGVVVVLR